MDRLAELNLPESNPFRNLIGFKFTQCGDGTCCAELEIRNHHLHSGGVVQGGVAFTMADATMATALSDMLEPGQFTATIELKMSYLAPLRDGVLRCESWIVQKGRRVAFMESKVSAADTLIATATASFAIIDPH